MLLWRQRYDFFRRTCPLPGGTVQKAGRFPELRGVFAYFFPVFETMFGRNSESVERAGTLCAGREWSEGVISRKGED